MSDEVPSFDDFEHPYGDYPATDPRKGAAVAEHPPAPRPMTFAEIEALYGDGAPVAAPAPGAPSGPRSMTYDDIEALYGNGPAR